MSPARGVSVERWILQWGNKDEENSAANGSMGLPGKAYSKKHFIWLMGANEVESKVFCRAILAKSARIQTVVCIPLLDGVLELGTTQRVKEDTGFIHHVKSFFTEQQQQTKPALSEHSTSNPTTFPEQVHFYSGNTPPSGLVDQDGGTAGEGGEEDDDQEEDEEQEDEYEEDELEPANTPIGAAEATELMQLDISEPIRLGSPEDGSNNMDSDFHLVAGNTADFPRRADSFKAETAISWAHFQDLQHLPGVPSHEELSQEDTHYSQTVTAILEHLSDRNSTLSSIMGCIFHSANSAFTTCPSTTTTTVPSSSQWLLKTILFTVPFLHTKYQGEAASPKSRDADSSTASRLRKGGGAEEPSGNHVLAERRRREKLNERFIILRSLVPFVTKMDKASILGDTIEYVKQLRKRIQDLEARARQSELSKDTDQKGGTGTGKVLQGRSKRRITRTITEGITVGGGGQAKITAEDEDEVVQVEVSIIESDALVELRCPYKEGLLLDLMQTLRELWVEVVSIQSSLNNNGFFLAELRAKVKENIYGRKASILEVKKSIHQIIPRV